MPERFDIYLSLVKNQCKIEIKYHDSGAVIGVVDLMGYVDGEYSHYALIELGKAVVHLAGYDPAYATFSIDD